MHLQSPLKSISSILLILVSQFILAVCLVSYTLLMSTAVQAQTQPQAKDDWTDSSGEKTVTATFVKLDGIQLTLRKADGKELVIPLYKLDNKSRLKARLMAKNVGNASSSTSDSADASSSIQPGNIFLRPLFMARMGNPGIVGES